jgi:hypothetical protein
LILRVCGGNGGQASSEARARAKQKAIAAFARQRKWINERFRKTPSGRRTGCAPSSVEPWMASLKIVEKNQAGELALIGERALSLVTFFVPAKKVTRRKAEAFDSTGHSSMNLTHFSGRQRPRV